MKRGYKRDGIDLTIETERLLIYPISDEAMRELISSETDPELKKAYSEMLQGCINEPENRIWHAVWFLELKSQPGTVVGDLSFKGICTGGAVEIGYGLRDGFCKAGYMREAVRAAVIWALSQEGVLRVEAETEPGNSASQKLLAACGFVPTGTEGEEGPRFVFKHTSIDISAKRDGGEIPE